MADKILLVAASFYPDLTAALTEGARAALQEAGMTQDYIEVRGVLEIPPAISYAADSGKYAGYVALGVVIRGQTHHFETVCAASAYGLMLLSVQRGLAIGNAIQTVENEEQAWARCRRTEKDRGGHGVRACLALLAAKNRLASGAG